MDHKVTRTIALSMDEVEAKWLMDLMCNAFEDESRIDAEMRQVFYVVLSSAFDE